MYFLFAMPMFACAYRLMLDPRSMALGQQWSFPLFTITTLVGPPPMQFLSAVAADMQADTTRA